MALKDYISERGIIAVLAIAAFSFLIYCGHDGTINVFFGMIITWYFSRSKDSDVAIIPLNEEERDKVLHKLEKYIDKRIEELKEE